MRILKDLIIKPVLAQTQSDAVAQPTFFTDIDFSDLPTPGPTPTPQGEGTIRIETDATSFLLNEEFEVEVSVDSNGEDLVSYTVKIEYDSDLLQVVDEDQTTNGIQVQFTDTEFSEVENVVNASTGSITIKGEVATAASKRGQVASIRFVSVAEGPAEIQVVESESSLVNDASTNVLDRVNGLQFTVGESIGEASDIIESPLTPRGIAETIKELPESGLPFGGVIYMAIGTLLIGIGLRARQIHKRSRK